jgi:hypothetical protein
LEVRKPKKSEQDSQGLQEKFCKEEQDCFGPGDRLRLLSKLKISKFRSLSEFYIIIFLNKLKIVENIAKN